MTAFEFARLPPHTIVRLDSGRRALLTRTVRGVAFARLCRFDGNGWKSRDEPIAKASIAEVIRRPRYDAPHVGQGGPRVVGH